MKTYTAIDGERIDSIVHRHYGTLDTALEAVIAANPQLPAILCAGDVVTLPAVTIVPKQAKLW
jgi:phage tail protein X